MVFTAEWKNIPTQKDGLSMRASCLIQNLALWLVLELGQIVVGRGITDSQEELEDEDFKEGVDATSPSPANSEDRGAWLSPFRRFFALRFSGCERTLRCFETGF